MTWINVFFAPNGYLCTRNVVGNVAAIVLILLVMVRKVFLIAAAVVMTSAASAQTAADDRLPQTKGFLLDVWTQYGFGDTFYLKIGWTLGK